MGIVVTRRWYTVLVAVALAVMVSFSAAPSSPLSVVSAAPASAAAHGFPLGEPSYDSGWLEIGLGGFLVLTHNLGGNTDSYYVVLEGRDSRGSGRKIMHTRYGGDFVTNLPADAEGIAWHHLTSTTISVYRAGNDWAFNDKIRVRIWVARPANYDSGWITIPRYEEQVLAHNLGGNVDDYLVYLEFRSAAWGINQAYLGMDTYYGPALASMFIQGGYWFGLTTSQIRVVTGLDSASTIAELRLRIWRAPAPDYDSSWQAVTPGHGLTFNHNLGGPWNDFVVDLQFKDDPGVGTFGTNIRRYGGDCWHPDGGGAVNCEGAYWTEFSANEIFVYREAQDPSADQVRVRIWASSKPKYRKTFDPAVLSFTTLTHNLGGSTDDYVVDLQFKHITADGSVGTGVNHANYGGDVRCAGDPLALKGYGVFWDNLTSTAIRITRLPDDLVADRVQARMWVAPPADYDSDWFDIAQNATVNKTHSLGGALDDYVVYLEFKDTDVGGIGVNQQSYGGEWFNAACGGVQSRVGGYWLQLSSTSVAVKREWMDEHADQMRIRIWRNSVADYSSSWTAVGPGGAGTFAHSLNWDPAGLVTYLTFQDATPAGKGIHHQAYGGNAFLDAGVPGGTRFIGAYWGLSTSSSVRVSRQTNDEDADQVRVRVWRAGPTEMLLPVISR